MQATLAERMCCLPCPGLAPRPLPCLAPATPADIGGISPGSMPPHSHSLVEEGAAIISFKLVQGGRWAALDFKRSIDTQPPGLGVFSVA